eukprot:1972318-Prymnesium_polylepis.1
MRAALECGALNFRSHTSSGLTVGRVRSTTCAFDSSALSRQKSAQLNFGKMPSFCQPLSHAARHHRSALRLQASPAPRCCARHPQPWPLRP